MIESIDTIQRNFIQAFNEIGDWMLQYEFLLQVGAELEPYPEALKDASHLVPGCQSKVWVHCSEQDGIVHILGDSEALIVKGIIAVAIVMFQNQKAEDIAKAEVSYIRDTAIREQISTDRFQGVHSVISRIQSFAVEVQEQKICR